MKANIPREKKKVFNDFKSYKHTLSQFWLFDH